MSVSTINLKPKSGSNSVNDFLQQGSRVVDGANNTLDTINNLVDSGISTLNTFERLRDKITGKSEPDYSLLPIDGAVYDWDGYKWVKNVQKTKEKNAQLEQQKQKQNQNNQNQQNNVQINQSMEQVKMWLKKPIVWIIALGVGAFMFFRKKGKRSWRRSSY